MLSGQNSLFFLLFFLLDLQALEGLIAVNDAVVFLDRANHGPVVLVGDGQEGVELVGLEFRCQGRAAPVEAVKSVHHLAGQIRMQVVNVAVGGCGKRLGLPDDAQIIPIDHPFIGHPVQDAGCDGRRVVVLVGDPP